MKQLLIVSYDFPPSTIGIWRTLKFCRYLPEFGWQPSVLTVLPVRAPRQDDGPLSELPPGTKIRRTESWDHNRIAYRRFGIKADPIAAKENRPAGSFGRFARKAMDVARSWLLLPDDRILWAPFAIKEGKRWLQKKRFDAVYTTSFPNTAHLVGHELAKRHRLPHLADFRDAWIGNYTFHRPATPLHDLILRKMEHTVIRHADEVVTATDPITEDFRRRYPAKNPRRFTTITNGYDPCDYDFSAAKPNESVYTITFTGTMYGDQSPEVFLEAVRRLLTAEPALGSFLRLRFVGTLLEHHQQMIEEKHLAAITTCIPYLPHREALTEMANADALLLLVADVPGAEIMMTQKVFEYAAARRPIIGLVPKGAARDFLTALGQGPVHAPNDTDALIGSLRSMLYRWRTDGRLTLGENSLLTRYQRRELTGRLATVLDRMVKRRESRRAR